MPPPGQRDYSGVRLTRHALERFVERFECAHDDAPGALRAALARTRQLGTNAENQAVAVLAVHCGRALVAVLQGDACLTVLTWNQFAPRLPEFGRAAIPRKWGRLLRRLTEPGEEGQTGGLTAEGAERMSDRVDGMNRIDRMKET
jgi:hypothetical protein